MLIKPYRFILSILVVAFLTNLLWLGSRGLHESTEGRYAEAAREMRLARNYLVPTLDGNPHWSKPPLAYWMISAGMAILGENAWGARLGGAIASALVAALLASVGEQLWDRKTGAVSALIWVTALLPAAGSQTVSTDIYLAAAEMVALTGFILAWQKRQPTWFALMWLGFGLGFLIKGPPSLLPLFPALWFGYRLKFLKDLFSPVGLLIFLFVGGAWYIWAIITHPGLLDYYIGVEVIQRVSSNTVHNAQWTKALTLYVPLLLLSLGTWGWLAIWIEGKRGLRHRLPSLIRAVSPAAFLAWSVLFPFLIFCLVKSKLPLYLLPLTAPLTLLCARSLSRTLHPRSLLLIGILSLAPIVGAKLVAATLPHKNDMRQLASLVVPVTKQYGSAQLLAFRQTKLFGLQFYLQKPLLRVSDSNQKSDYPVEVVPIHKALEHSSSPVLIVTRIRDNTRLEKSLKDSEWEAETLVRNQFWSVLELKKKATPQIHSTVL